MMTNLDVAIFALQKATNHVDFCTDKKLLAKWNNITNSKLWRVLNVL